MDFKIRQEDLFLALRFFFLALLSLDTDCEEQNSVDFRWLSEGNTEFQRSTSFVCVLWFDCSDPFLSPPRGGTETVTVRSTK